MSPRARSLATFILLVAGFTLAGCDGTGSEAVPADTPRADVAATPAPTPLSLNEYLVTTFRLTAETSLAIGELMAAMPSLTDDPEGFSLAASELAREGARMTRESLETLAALTPPAEAISYHTTYVAFLEDTAAIQDELATASEANDQTQITALGLELFGLLEGSGDLAEELQRLTVGALEAGEATALSTYLIAATDARTELARAGSDFGVQFQEVAASVQTEEDAQELMALLEGLVDRVDGYQTSWQKLQPPPEAAEFHQDQAAVMARMIEGERLLLSALRNEDGDGLLEVLTAANDVIGEAGPIGAQWNELLIQALSD